jgi:hypothetical protein
MRINDLRPVFPVPTTGPRHRSGWVVLLDGAEVSALAADDGDYGARQRPGRVLLPVLGTNGQPLCGCKTRRRADGSRFWRDRDTGEEYDVPEGAVSLNNRLGVWTIGAVEMRSNGE